jgi:hypothetical protein
MQNTHFKVQIIRNCCGLSLSESPVQFKFTVSKNMDFWFMKQPKSGERIIDTFVQAVL